ncbi:hypothetical protein V6N13_148089 [Hibiscus sabdariffa]|uniref:Uncharacterized protein n=1 Tax=Hibiscus sabdariffa TaxID=183260 RepID=A0ABR2TXJ6_9ROSI
MGGVAWTEEEDQLLKKCIERWSLIAGRLPGRTANDVKNYWNCHLSKKLSAQETEEEHKSAVNVELITPQPAPSIAISGSTKPRTQDYHVAPNSLPAIQESGMSTPFNFIEVDLQGHELVKEAMDIRVEEPAGGVLVGDLGTEDHQFGQFDEVNVLGRTGEGCSKWDWDDLMLDMDLWTDSL